MITAAIILLAIAVCFCAGSHLPSGTGWAALLFGVLALLAVLGELGHVHL
jgi:hypothetical protein